MKATDIAWAAGFLEGEGSFTFVKGTIRVSANQVQREPLERLATIFGGNIHDYSAERIANRESRRKWKWQRSPYSAWEVNQRHAVGVMFLLWTLMSPKRRGQIGDAIAKWKNWRYRNGTWKTHCKNGHRWVPGNLYVWRYASRCRICWHDTQPERTVSMRRYRAKYPERIRVSIAKYRKKRRGAADV